MLPLFLSHRLQQSYIISQPFQYFQFEIPVNWSDCGLRRYALLELAWVNRIQCALSVAITSSWLYLQSLHFTHYFVEVLVDWVGKTAEIPGLIDDLHVFLLPYKLLIFILRTWGFLWRWPWNILQWLYSPVVRLWLPLLLRHVQFPMTVGTIRLPLRVISESKSILRNVVVLLIVYELHWSLPSSWLSTILCLTLCFGCIIRTVGLLMSLLNRQVHAPNHVRYCWVVARVLRRCYLWLRTRTRSIFYDELISGFWVQRPTIAFPNYICIIHIIK